MDLDLAPAIESFLDEAADFVVELEENILALEEAPDDQELINSTFRAAHTIKGSGGLFGFDHLVKFTHVFESVLMRMRDGSLLFNKEIAEILLASVDHLGQMLKYIDLEGEHIPEDVTEASDQLGMMLEMFLSDDQAPAVASDNAPGSSVNVTSETAPSQSTISANSQCECWHLSLRFGENVLRDGMDPASFLRYLQRLGEITYLKTLGSHIPALEEMDPEQSYLGFEIQLKSDSDREEILDVFEFVQEQSLIQIIPPKAPLNQYREHFDALPESTEQLGEILLESGALSEEEWQWCLSGEAADVDSSQGGESNAEVTIRKKGNDQVLVFSDAMTIYRAEAISAQLHQTVTTYPEPLSAVLKVDLSAVEDMDTAGAQILVALQKTLAASGTRISDVAHSDASRALFELYQLDLSAA